MRKKDIIIYDIAGEPNLSHATISRVLKTEGPGFLHNFFESNLRKQKTHTIGVMVHELNSNFINSVLSGIKKFTNLFRLIARRIDFFSIYSFG